MFHHWRDALKLACNQKVLVDGQMVNHNRRVKQGCLREWRQFTLKSRAEKHRDKTVSSKVRMSYGFIVIAQEKKNIRESFLLPRYFLHAVFRGVEVEDRSKVG